MNEFAKPAAIKAQWSGRALRAQAAAAQALERLQHLAETRGSSEGA